MAPVTYRIKRFQVGSIAKFMALIGFIWGLLAGIILIATYIWGYSTNGDASLLTTGLYGFGLMIVYGIIGGVVGGAIMAAAYNRFLGPAHGIMMELEPGK